MTIRCECCQTKFEDRGFLAVTDDYKTHFLCQGCGLWYEIFGFSRDISEIFHFRKIENVKKFREEIKLKQI